MRRKPKLKPGDIVANDKTLGMVMRNEDELLVAYPGHDELTIETDEVKRKGNIEDIEDLQG
jgi:hypothetical protein